MKTMTVRGIDPIIAEKLRRAAKAQGKSVNQIVVETIQKSFGLDKQKKFTQTYDDLDHLFGKWSQEEFDQIQGKIDAERTIDEELWQ
jgi:ribosomal protein S24E